MTKTEIYEIINKCKSNGHNVSTKDIGCMLLKKEIGDIVLAYHIIFDSNDIILISKYEAHPRIKFLKNILNDWYITKNKNKTKKEAAIDKILSIKASKKENLEDLTFDENKASLIQMLSEIKDAVASGELNKKDALTLETNIRTKLVDKFNTAEEIDKNYIIVEQKMNNICECGREFYDPLKDADFMKHYHKEEE